jgi:hypothetical protein
VTGQRPPYPAREGHYVEYRFEIGSSGLFGRELPEIWRDDKALARRCRAVILPYRLAGVLERLVRLGLPPRKIERASARFLPLAGARYDIHAALD